MDGIRVDRFAGVFGESVTVARPAHPGLRAHVLGYTGYREHTAFARRREPPIAAVPLIVDLGGGLTVLDPADPTRSRTGLGGFVAGPTDRAGIVDSGGRQVGLQVNLTLVGARLFLDRPLREVTRQAVSLEELFGADGRRLVERLRAVGTWEARFALLDRELGTRCRGAAEPPPDVLWAWQALTRSSGSRTVNSLAAELGCSRKHLSTRFSAQLGLPPKTLAGILRFRRVVDRLDRGAPASLADLAAGSGYYDQAHLDRDFRRFAGITPTQYRSRYTPELGLPAE